MFGTAAYEKKFSKFFEDAAGNNRTYSTGLEYGYDIPWVDKMKLSASAAYGLVNASDDSADQSFAQAKGSFSTPLWWWAAFDIEGSAARRWLENVNPVAGFKERRTEWAGSAGLNFAPAIVHWTGGDSANPWLRKLKVGYNYFERNSNVAGADRTSSSPSVAIAVGQDF